MKHSRNITEDEPRFSAERARPKYFALLFQREMFRTAIVEEIGTHAAYMLDLISLVQDNEGQGWIPRVGFSNEDLARKVGFGRTSLEAARAAYRRSTDHEARNVTQEWSRANSNNSFFKMPKSRPLRKAVTQTWTN